MDMSNPLDQLRPNHLPDPVSWWPPAIGWWISALLIIGLVVLVSLLMTRAIRKNRYRRQAKRIGKQLLSDFQQHGDKRQFVQACNQLLKRTALQAYPSDQVAKLSGQPWQQFLSDTSGNKAFLETAGAALGEQLYQNETNIDVDALHSMTLSWIKKHYV